MKPRQGFINGLGATIAFLLGVPYLVMLFLRIWGATAGPVSIVTWVALAVGATFGVIVVLTTLLPPSNLWLYPAMFALCTLIFGVGAIDKPTAAAFWLIVGVATVGLGYGFGRLWQVARRRAQSAP